MVSVLKSIFMTLIVLIGFTSCEPRENSESLLGTWKSIGYGKVMVVDTSGYKQYDVTEISCLPDDHGTLRDLKAMTDLENDTLSIRLGYDIYRYERTESLPDVCGEKLSAQKMEDPLYNFEVFAATYRENYYYFEMNNIPWDSLYLAYENRINDTTTRLELYTIIRSFIDELKDNHGYIEPDDDTYNRYEAIGASETDNSGTLRSYGDFEVADRVAEYYLMKDMTKDSRLIKWGIMEDNIGYIQVKAMWLYGELNLDERRVNQIGTVEAYNEKMNTLTELERYNVEIDGINKILDDVMEDLDSTQYAILDVRFNGGGSDEVGLQILRRFNSHKIKVASKRARDYDGYTESIPIFLDGYDNAYTKPLYVLTSQQSASATDFLAMATMAMNNVERIGSHTNGALSDALEKNLPNGWYLSLSNEEYLAIDGLCYESKGITPNYELNYPPGRQTFFRGVLNNLESDRNSVMNAINALR